MVNLIVNWCQLWVFSAFFFPSRLPRHSGWSNWRPHWFGSLNRFEAGKRPRHYIVKKNGSKQSVIQLPDLWYWNILGRFVECIFFLQWPGFECLFGGGFVAPKGGEEFGFFQFWFPRFQAWDLRTQWKCLRMRAAACLGPMEGLEGQVSTTQDVQQKGNGQTKSQQPVYDKKSQKISIEIERMGKVRLWNPDDNKLSHHSELADFANQARNGCPEGMLRVPQAGRTHSMQSFAGIKNAWVCMSMLLGIICFQPIWIAFLCFDRMRDHRPILLLFLGDSLVSGVGAQAQQNFGKNKCDCGLEWVVQRLNYFSSMVQLTRSKCQQWAH